MNVVLTKITPQGRAMRAARTKPDVDSIVDSLSVEEKELLGCTPDTDYTYLTLGQGEYVLKRCIKYVDDVAVSFFDMLDDGDNINLALATRAGDEYRGNGYASEVAEEAMSWMDNHPEVRKGRDIVWGVRDDNEGSIAIAEKLGFVEDPSSYNDGWVNYVNTVN